MEEIGKKRLAAAGVVAAGLVYFLVCASPLQKELILVPVWTRSVSQAPAAPTSKKGLVLQGAASGAASSAPIPFRLGDRFGYFTPDGSLLFAAPLSYGVAMASDAFAPYERLSEGFTIESPEGASLVHVSSVGYPFFAAGRRFVMGPDQATVSELTKGGATAWTYKFTSIVTAFDACPSIAVFGLMDGSIVGIDGSGSAALSFAPGGSKLSGVYGVAASPDGLLVAAITGLDKQRLVIMERRSAAYRVAYHRYLESDYRRPVYIAFTADGRRLEYESPSGVSVYDRATRSETIVSVPASSRLGLTTRNGELVVFLSGSGEGKRLVCTALPDRRVVDVSFRAKLAFAETRGDSLFLGFDDDIVRMDLQER
jgi:hypothetical protein